VELSLRMPAEHIRVIDIKPGIYRMGSRAKIPHMVAEQSESIDFYLEPLICGNIPVTPIAIYLDAYGDTYMAKGNPLSVVSKCPLILNPGEENIAKVKNLLESQEYITSYRTIELAHDAKKSFELLRESIGAWAGKPVSKPIYISEKPFKAETYFYVLNQNPDDDLGHREEIIVKLNINEENKVAVLTAGAEKNTTVNGVLTHIWHLANTRFGEKFGFDLKGINCPECGAGFEEIDKDSDTVKCKYCGENFQKKAIK